MNDTFHMSKNVLSFVVLAGLIVGPVNATAQSAFGEYSRTLVYTQARPTTSGFGGRPKFVNNKGHWLGGSNNSTIAYVAILTESGVSYPFGTTTGTKPVALNDFGMVLGTDYSGTYEVAIFRDASGVVARIPFHAPIALNNNGEILLQEFDVGGIWLARAKIRRRDGTLEDLTALNNAYPKYTVTDMNDRGDIVGFVGSTYIGNYFTGPDLFLLRAGTTTPVILGRFTEKSKAWINNAGQIVIEDFRQAGFEAPQRRSYFWSQGRLTDLAPSSSTSSVADFNDRGELIVAWMDRDLPFLFRDGQRIALGLLPREMVYGISDSGSIDYIQFDDCFIVSPCFERHYRGDPPLGASELEATVDNFNLSLTWRAPKIGPAVTSYVLEAGSTFGASNVATRDLGSTATSLTTTVPAGTYFLRVRARSGTTMGRPSNEVIVTVPSGACTMAPDAPTSLRATLVGNEVTLNWSPVREATSYVVVVTWPANLYSFDTGSTATSYTARAPNGTYVIHLRARNACGTSGTSEQIRVDVGCTVPPAPVLFDPQVNGSSVTLAWQAVPGVTTYKIEAGSASALSNIANFPVYATTSFTGSPPNGTYYVRVLAENACGVGPPSNEKVAIVRAP
jgi:hypothetical protein